MYSIDIEASTETALHILNGAYSRAIVEHGGDSTVVHELEQALKHVRNAKQSHETGLPLLPCVKSEDDELWHIEDIIQKEFGEITIGVVDALCTRKLTTGTLHQPRIPTCPDCIKTYREKGLV